MFLKYAKIDTMKTEEPISIGLCVQIMIDTIGQDCLLDYLAEPPASKDYACQRQKFERLKKRKAFDPTTIKNLEEFSDFIKDWSEWLIGDGYSSGITTGCTAAGLTRCRIRTFVIRLSYYRRIYCSSNQLSSFLI